MPRSLIVYFSQGGTTAKVAAQIAEGLRSQGFQTDLCNLKEGKTPSLAGYDLLGIGSPVYYYRLPFNVADFLNSMPSGTGLAVFTFLLNGTYAFDAVNQVRTILNRKRVREVGFFQCLGKDLFLGYLKQGYLFSPEHPTQSELIKAQAFGWEVAVHLASKPEDVLPPPIIYRLERLVFNRWLVEKIYTRLFAVDAKKCNSCGVCIKICPLGNITKGRKGLPVWGQRCLFCLTCEMKCPQDAIKSPLDLFIFRPFLRSNVRHACRDQSLEHVQVVHSRGRTRTVQTDTDQER